MSNDHKKTGQPFYAKTECGPQGLKPLDLQYQSTIHPGYYPPDSNTVILPRPVKPRIR